MKLSPAEDNFVTVSQAPARVDKFIRYEVAPDYRYYAEGAWHVHLKYLQAVVDYAGAEIDTQKLPANITRALNIETSMDPYSVLHVTKSAPLCVVKAAYKALSLFVHPDQGGTTEQSVQLNKAYQRVINERSGRD